MNKRMPAIVCVRYKYSFTVVLVNGFACPWTSNFIIMFSSYDVTFAQRLYYAACALSSLCMLTCDVCVEFRRQESLALSDFTLAACARLLFVYCIFLSMIIFAEFRLLFASYDMISHVLCALCMALHLWAFSNPIKLPHFVYRSKFL